jgi:excinuclease ABC subunit C
MREDFPGVYFTRTPQPRGTKLYGPFTSAAGLRAAIGELQRIFRFRTCKLDLRADDPRLRYNRPCILYPIRRCTGPCAGHIGKADYRRGMERLRRFLEGKRAAVIRDLAREMKALAAALKFEEAALVRDQLRAIEALAERGRLTEHLQPEVFAPTFDPAEGMAELGRVLGTAQPIRTIEGVDIANLGPREAVGAVVPFIDGRPFKAGYRRFRIRTVAGQDDVAMIGEVVGRRFRRLAAELSVLPDLVLVDGGPGQLAAAAEAVRDSGAAMPLVASLAKRQEEVYVLGRAETEPLRLARTNAALKVLQAVRDEAHRFAQHYHHLLRRKAVLGEKPARQVRPRRKGRRRRRPPGPGGTAEK